MKTESSRRSFLLTVAGAACLSASRLLEADEGYWEMVRGMFPFGEERIPMNAGNLCPSPRSVSEQVAELTRDIDRDLSYTNREKFAELLERSRAKIARHIGAETDEIALVRNTSEANSTIITGLRLGPGDEVLLWDENHPTNGVAWNVQAERAGFDVRRVAAPRRPSAAEELLDAFDSALGPRTRVLAVSHVSNYNGVRLPVAEISAAARARDIFVLVDGAQSWGGLAIDVKRIGCDAFTASAHKWLCGPKEAGLLYLRRDRWNDVWPRTVAFGWNDDVASGQRGARKFESLGQRDDACLAALATTVDFHLAIGVERIEKRMQELATALKDGLAAQGVPLETPLPTSVSAGVVTVSVRPEDRRALVFELDRLGVAGSPAGGLRLCPHVYNTIGHVERAVHAVASLRSWITAGAARSVPHAPRADRVE